MRLMPVTGDDLLAARRIVEMGYPAVAPVMRDMVRWMRVAESPVADTFAAFFGQLGQSAVSAIAEGLMRENCWLRHRIFTQILPKWPADVLRGLTNMLTMVATQPDAYDNDLLCVAVLIQHRLADLEWVRQWITFKKERWAVRNDLLIKVEEELKRVQQSPGGDSSTRADAGLGTPQG
jgi:hypothetical protein